MSAAIDQSGTAARLTRRRILRLSVPVMLAQAAIAATGVVDTVVIGLYGTKVDLAAVAVASIVFSFLYWAFGFLRMSTTGLVAQAVGADHASEARLVLQRALVIGAVFGVSLFALSPFLASGAFSFFSVEPAVKGEALGYFQARIWGAPALLMSYAITGWLLGTGRTGALLGLQIIMNGVNAGLDIWFVAGLGWGPTGIGAGTAIAEWVAAGVGFVLIWPALRRAGYLYDRAALGAMFNANRDILIRTIALLTCFAWFTRSGALMGTAQLAGNEVLLQFIAVAAFVLDGFAFVAEKEIGEAYGRRDRQTLRRAMRLTSELAVGFAAFITLLYFGLGPSLIDRVIADDAARQAALAFLPYCAVVPLLGVAAWQLDGFFLGATQGRALRNAGVLAAAGYIAADLTLRPLFANHGVWIAFMLMFVFRALALSLYLPALFSSFSEDRRPQPQPQS